MLYLRWIKGENRGGLMKKKTLKDGQMEHLRGYESEILP